ncbi:MAG: cupin domain-containing protein [Alphaproteobacteria bacterium]|nr:cupin domain-containing protein [Alphaproteobacteria bacterium]
MEHPRHLVRTRDLGPDTEVRVRHPMNPNSEVHIRHLSDRAGMQRAHMSLARVPPGKESFIFHSHAVQEEFIFILSGAGTAEIGDQRIAVGPGDYMGFPTDGVGHHLVNTGDEDLVYLMGGERSAVEIGTFPRHNMRLLFEGGAVSVFDTTNAQQMTMEDWYAKD